MDVWLEGRARKGNLNALESRDQKCATFCEPITRDRVKDLLFSHKTLRYLHMVQVLHMCRSGYGAWIKQKL